MSENPLIGLFNEYFSGDNERLQSANTAIINMRDNDQGNFILYCCDLINSNKFPATWVSLCMSILKGLFNDDPMASHNAAQILSTFNEEYDNLLLSAQYLALQYSSPLVREYGAKNLRFIFSLEKYSDFFKDSIKNIVSYIKNEDNSYSQYAKFGAIALFTEILSNKDFPLIIEDENYLDFQNILISACISILSLNSPTDYENKKIILPFLGNYTQMLKEIDTDNNLSQHIDLTSILQTAIQNSNESTPHDLPYGITLTILQFVYPNIEEKIINDIFAWFKNDLALNNPNNKLACDFWADVMKLMRTNEETINKFPQQIYVQLHEQVYAFIHNIRIDDNIFDDDNHIIYHVNNIVEEFSQNPLYRQSFLENFIATFNTYCGDDSNEATLFSLFVLEFLFSYFDFLSIPNSDQAFEYLISKATHDVDLIRHESFHILIRLFKTNLQDLFSKYQDVVAIAIENSKRTQQDAIFCMKFINAAIQPDFAYYDETFSMLFTCMLGIIDIMLESHDPIERKLIDSMKDSFKTVLFKFYSLSNAYIVFSEVINPILDKAQNVLTLSEGKNIVDKDSLQDLFSCMLEQHADAIKSMLKRNFSNHDFNTNPKPELVSLIDAIMERIYSLIIEGFENQNILVTLSKYISLAKIISPLRTDFNGNYFVLLVKYVHRVVSERDFSAILNLSEILPNLINTESRGLIEEVVPSLIDGFYQVINNDYNQQSIRISCIKSISILFELLVYKAPIVPELIDCIYYFKGKDPYAEIDESLRVSLIIDTLRIHKTFIRLYQDDPQIINQYKRSKLFYPLIYVEKLQFNAKITTELVISIYEFLSVCTKSSCYKFIQNQLDSKQLKSIIDGEFFDKAKDNFGVYTNLIEEPGKTIRDNQVESGSFKWY